ncbi:TorD/DmsD family molecular chaperone [Raoultibacter phocaeensis]|uniref:TorD/DmsD family molecular chaperone n=1 Tax=Raoultibacter phocaeensis TaxID=2479841 RepID=UPI00111A6EFF|nr:molecular chaperone TorD family protein [Raoultibacter phocaeensis]
MGLFEKEDALGLILDERASIYALLARLYREEIRDDLSELTEISFPDDTANEKANTGAVLMNSYLKEVGTVSETELSVDFARLFVLREQHTRNAAYPFESVYTSQTHIVMDDARDDVLSVYRANEFQKKADCKLAEDHLALELEFEQMLSVRALDAYRRNDDERLAYVLAQQRSFLERHLLNWVGLFAEAMVSEARTDFYRGLAWFTVGFLELDRSFLESLADDE